ncbi:MAG: hypothetical protein H3C31_02540 [Brumimicrobium sp.]|nr:hypothetical protein [Brumimicrobium sp.]
MIAFFSISYSFGQENTENQIQVEQTITKSQQEHKLILDENGKPIEFPKNMVIIRLSDREINSDSTQVFGEKFEILKIEKKEEEKK